MTDIADALLCLFSAGGTYASGLVIDHEEHPETPTNWEDGKEDEGRKIWVGGLPDRFRRRRIPRHGRSRWTYARPRHRH